MEIKPYENMIWYILDDESKEFVISYLAEQGFQGECKLVAIINGDVTNLQITDNYEHSLVLPIDILDILNN